MKIAPFLRKYLPLWFKKRLDNSNSRIAKFVTSKLGPLSIKKVEELVLDPTTPTICMCPRCAEAIKVNDKGQVGVILYYEDRTSDKPDVKIEKKYTLSRVYRDHSYQVGCSNISCCGRDIRGGDLFGVLDTEGNLVIVAPPLAPTISENQPAT
ncbi:MAG: hypothetical protein WCO18_00440 [bacterium]